MDSEPMTSLWCECNAQRTELYEATQMGAGQFVGLISSRERSDGRKKCLFKHFFPWEKMSFFCLSCDSCFFLPSLCLDFCFGGVTCSPIVCMPVTYAFNFGPPTAMTTVLWYVWAAWRWSLSWSPLVGKRNFIGLIKSRGIYVVLCWGAFAALVTNDNRDFKICDSTVTKTSFKIASSGLLIFFVVMSACLTSKN